MTSLFPHVDESVSPRDDLFRHVNGAWLSTAQIPVDKSQAGAFIDLSDLTEERVKKQLEASRTDDPDADQAKLAALWASYLDTDRIEALGATPLEQVLQKIDAISTVEELSSYLGWAMRYGVGTALAANVEVDFADPTRQIMFLWQAGLGLPDEEYYRLDNHAETRKKYVAYLETILDLAGEDPQQAADAMSLETALAAHHWDKVKVRDLTAMHNPMSFDELAESAPGLDWQAWREAAHLPAEALGTINVSQPSFVTGFAELVSSTQLSTWQAWAKARAISALASYLTDDFVQAKFAFYEGHLGGVQELRARWKRAVDFVEGAMGEAIGRQYVAQHFPPEAKAQMDDLVKHLLLAYRESIEKLEWLTDATREQALDKLSKFTPKVGYRRNWRDYSALQVDPQDLVGNAMAVAAHEMDYWVAKLGKPVDPDEWHMFPQTVNAYYHPMRNEIVFPAAILQPPFFYLNGDLAVNYGAIGSVIGHEIGHGFDDKGSTCDGDGKLRDWWTPEDRAAFEELTSALVGQYDGLSPEDADGETVNGEMTLGENIGDLGGLGIAYKAWLLAGGDPNGEKVDGLTPAQRFFYGWAAVWRGKKRPEKVKLALATDVHSPQEFRCNQVVRNLDAFHEAFGVTEGDALWLDPAQRVTIW